MYVTRTAVVPQTDVIVSLAAGSGEKVGYQEFGRANRLVCTSSDGDRYVD